jgi:predicted nuclease of predicted toxin-antitoxin system
VKFKLDENIPSEMAGFLLALGHDAQTVFDEGLTGSLDLNLLEHVRHEHRVFLTMDKGIADIRVYPPSNYEGIILFRPTRTGRNEAASFIRRFLPSVLEQEMAGHLFVVTERGIRKR